MVLFNIFVFCHHPPAHLTLSDSIRFLYNNQEYAIEVFGDSIFAILIPLQDRVKQMLLSGLRMQQRAEVLHGAHTIDLG